MDSSKLLIVIECLLLLMENKTQNVELRNSLWQLAVDNAKAAKGTIDRDYESPVATWYDLTGEFEDNDNTE